jgi:hypothetical protein
MENHLSEHHKCFGELGKTQRDVFGGLVTHTSPSGRVAGPFSTRQDAENAKYALAKWARLELWVDTIRDPAQMPDMGSTLVTLDEDNPEHMRQQLLHVLRYGSRPD